MGKSAKFPENITLLECRINVDTKLHKGLKCSCCLMMLTHLTLPDPRPELDNIYWFWRIIIRWGIKKRRRILIFRDICEILRPDQISLRHEAAEDKRQDTVYGLNLFTFVRGKIEKKVGKNLLFIRFVPTTNIFSIFRHQIEQEF